MANAVEEEKKAEVPEEVPDKKKKKKKSKPRRRNEGKEIVKGNPEEGVASGNSTSSMKDVKQPGFESLVRLMAGSVQDAWNNTYLTRRARSLPDDEIQYIHAHWEWDIRCYWDFGTPTVEEPYMYDATEKQLNNTFGYLRQGMKLSHKPRLYRDTITSGLLIDYINVYHFAVANCVSLQCMFGMSMYSEAFQRMSSYLPDKMIRLYRLWKRLSSITMINFVKQISIEDGKMVNGERHPTPHIRTWGSNNLVGYGGSGYSAYGSVPSLFTIMGVAASIDALLDDIECAVLYLEANVTAGVGSSPAEETLALREIMDFASTCDDTKISQHYGPGLPPLTGVPAITTNDAELNDWYCRAIWFQDNHGAGGDETLIFPVTHISDLNDLIPIKGYGERTYKEFTAFGGIKFGASWGNVSDGTMSIGSTGTHGRVIGSSKLLNNLSYVQQVQYMEIFTREDDDEAMNMASAPAVDFGDGASIRAFFNTGHPILKHIYAGMLFASQLGASQEYRFLDQRPVDYEHWMTDDKVCENTALLIAAMTGMPFLGGQSV